MRDAVTGTVSELDRLGQHSDESPGLLFKPSAGGPLPIDDQVIAHIAFRAPDRRFEPSMKGRFRELPYRVGP